MVRREMFEKAAVGIAALAGGSLFSLRGVSAQQERRRGGAVRRLDEAAQALVDEMNHSNRGRGSRSQANENEVLALMAAGALQGQTRVLQDRADEDLDLSAAARELNRQFPATQQRIVRGYASREVRQRLEAVRIALSDLTNRRGNDTNRDGRGIGGVIDRAIGNPR